jgi:hypothetical protein
MELHWRLLLHTSKLYVSVPSKCMLHIRSQAASGIVLIIYSQIEKFGYSGKDNTSLSKMLSTKCSMHLHEQGLSRAYMSRMGLSHSRCTVAWLIIVPVWGKSGDTICQSSQNAWLSCPTCTFSQAHSYSLTRSIDIPAEYVGLNSHEGSCLATLHLSKP